MLRKRRFQRKPSQMYIKTSTSDTFTRSYFTSFSHINAFTHRRFYTHDAVTPTTLLHIDTFTHRRFHTHKHFYTDSATHGLFYTQTLLQTDTFTHRNFYTQKLLHTDVTFKVARRPPHVPLTWHLLQPFSIQEELSQGAAKKYQKISLLAASVKNLAVNKMSSDVSWEI